MDSNHTGLTGGTHRFDRSDDTCQFWVRTEMLDKGDKACTISSIWPWIMEQNSLLRILDK
jgi:hypothetical protein